MGGGADGGLAFVGHRCERSTLGLACTDHYGVVTTMAECEAACAATAGCTSFNYYHTRERYWLTALNKFADLSCKLFEIPHDILKGQASNAGVECVKKDSE